LFRFTLLVTVTAALTGVFAIGIPNRKICAAIASTVVSLFSTVRLFRIFTKSFEWYVKVVNGCVMNAWAGDTVVMPLLNVGAGCRAVGRRKGNFPAMHRDTSVVLC
jgi:hypothetical protein